MRPPKVKMFLLLAVMAFSGVAFAQDNEPVEEVSKSKLQEIHSPVKIEVVTLELRAPLTCDIAICQTQTMVAIEKAPSISPVAECPSVLVVARNSLSAGFSKYIRGSDKLICRRVANNSPPIIS